MGEVGWIERPETQRPNVQQIQPASVSTAQDSIATDCDSDCTVAYDLESYMNMDYDEASNHSDNRSTNIPADKNDVIREVTPVAWLDNHLSSPQQQTDICMWHSSLN